MEDQLNFGTEYVSERDIIKRHYMQLGKIGGSVTTPKKAAAARRNAKLAQAARIRNARERRKTA